MYRFSKSENPIYHLIARTSFLLCYFDFDRLISSYYKPSADSIFLNFP